MKGTTAKDERLIFYLTFQNISLMHFIDKGMYVCNLLRAGWDS